MPIMPLNTRPARDTETLGRGSSGATPRIVAGAELLLAVAVVVGANVFDVVPITETPWLVLLGWLSLRLRGLRWRDLGLRRPERWGATVAVAIAAAAALQVASEFVTEPLIERLTGAPPDLSDFRDVAGNLPVALGWLALVWTLAAFGEEMAYRGYVLERAAALGGGSSRAYAIAVVALSLLFGLGHVYQGLAGVIGSSVSGLVFGTLYLAAGRNLWLPILTHGFVDTIGLLLIYLGLVRV